MQEFLVFLVLVFLAYLAVYLVLKILHLPMLIFKLILVFSVVIAAFSVLLISTGKMRDMPLLSSTYEQIVAFMDKVMEKLAPYLSKLDPPKK